MKQIKFSRNILAGFVMLGLLATSSMSFSQPTNSFAHNRYTPGYRLNEGKAFNFSIFPGSRSSRIILVTENPRNEKLTIVLTGQDGRLYYRVTHEGLLRTIFDLSTAEDGVYTITVRSGKDKFTRTFELNTVSGPATRTIDFN